MLNLQGLGQVKNKTITFADNLAKYIWDFLGFLENLDLK